MPIFSPEKINPVAIILVMVVPRCPARKPPIRGVQVLFKLNAAISRLNSVLEVPISRESLVFNGPRMYYALSIVRFCMIKGLGRVLLTNGFQCSENKRTEAPEF